MANMAKLPKRLLVVDWADTFSDDNGWQDVKDVITKPLLVRSVGFKVKAMKGYVSLSGMTATNGACSTFTHTPKGCVRRIIELKGWDKNAS